MWLSNGYIGQSCDYRPPQQPFSEAALALSGPMHSNKCKIRKYNVTINRHWIGLDCVLIQGKPLANGYYTRHL